MSKAARQRRLKQERQRRQRRAAQAGGRPGTGARWPGGPDSDYARSPRERVVRVVGEAVQAVCARRQAAYDSCLARLADTESPGWTEAVSRCLTEALRASASNAWRHGWQPAELTRHTGRELSEAHASMLADMITDETRGYAAAAVDDRWAAQVAALAATAPGGGTATLDGAGWWGSDADYLTAWRAEAGGRTSLGGLLGTIATAVEVLHQLQHLPVLERLLPLPGTAKRSTASRTARDRKTSKPADDRALSRIRALLAKAESTEFAEEAEALSTRAQELMAKYSIDHALLAAQEGEEETPGGRRIPVDNPYESPKVQLLTEVARANRCRTVWLKELGLITVIGFEADLDAVELLFTSLLVQANTAMMRAGGKRDAYGRSRTRAFRQSFLVSYAYRIGERLSEATDHVVREAAEEQSAAARDHAAPSGPGKELVPLLAARGQAVDDAVDEMFGDSLTATRAVRATDLEGWNSGRAAADMASLHNRDQVTD